MAITLASQVLPDPQRYTVSVQYRGKGIMMADGTPVFDLVSTTDKYKFNIGWVGLTTAQRTTLETAWATLKTESAALLDYDYDVGPPVVGSYTVSRDPAAPDLKFDAMTSAGGVRWNVSISLLEE